ncbi:MAG: hypothetical protein Q4P25_04155 [Tissierellia bacterium]|nr:hypothetical protein [Tissierellia bacterium]
MMTPEQREKSKKLSKYKWLSKELDSKLAELEKWKSRLTAANATYTDMPSSHYRSDKMSEGIASIIDIKATLEQDIKDLIRERDNIYHKINGVNNEQLKHILRQRYIDGLTFEMMAVQNDRSWRHIHRLHELALDEINF